MRHRIRVALALAANGLAVTAGAAPGAAALREPEIAPPRALRAEQISEQTAPTLQIGGPDAVGGVGDWYLANEIVEVVIDDVSRAFSTLNHGGTIVDAGLRDRRDEDQFARIFPLLDLDQKVVTRPDRIRAQVDPEGGWARVVVSGRESVTSIPRTTGLARWLDPLVPEPEALRNVFVETEYAVFRGEPFVHITTTIRNEGDEEAPLFSYGDVWMRGGRSMRAWVGNTLDPERTRGFHHRGFDRKNLLRSTEAMAPFTFVAVPGVRDFPPIAYAVFSPERVQRGERTFGVTGKHVNLMNTFTTDTGWERLGLLRLLRATRRGIPPGESFVYRRLLLVTGRSDVASATDVIFPLLGVSDGRSGIEGRVEPADLVTSVLVESDEGWPVTQILSETRGADAGVYRALLPPGDYELTLRAPQRKTRRLEVRVEPGRITRVEPLRFEEPGWLVFDPAFADGGAGRVIVTGEDETPDPVFGPELLDFRIDGEPTGSGSETRELQFIGGAADPRRVAIPPGSYRLTAVRGLEHDAVQTTVEVPGPGREVRVAPFDPPRVITLPGFVRGDFHVHAEASDDTATPNESRLRSFLAEGVDVLVTTDHDHLGHYDPALDALGVRDRIRVIQGVEVTSAGPSPAAPWTIGHHNSWPLRWQPLAHRQGAPPSQNRGVADLYASLRRDYGAHVVQLNHPRTGRPGSPDEGAYLTHLAVAGEGYDPRRPIDAPPNRLLLETGSDGKTRPIDFDAMELMNGSSFSQYRLVRADWYSLLLQGFRRTATANSDTHGPDRPAGYPRNYVWLGARELREEDLDEAVRGGRLFGTNGPLIATFRVNDARMGDLVAAPGGTAVVEVAVAAAPWVPVDEVRLLVNARVVRRWTDLDDDETVRVVKRLEVPLESDAFVTLEAGVPLDADPDEWIRDADPLYPRLIAPGFVPTAFANPIFVDVDGNGRFDAPGLPPAPEDTGASPLWWLLPLAILGLGFWLWRRRRA